MLGKAGQAKNVEEMRKALKMMSNAMGSAPKDCEASGKCTESIKEAKATVDALYNDLGMTPMNEGTLKKDFKKFMMSMGMMKKSCSMGLVSDVTLSAELFSSLTELPYTAKC